MKVLVTGGAGFIGSAACRLFVGERRASMLNVGRAYDTNPFRAVLADNAIEPVIPSTRRRKPPIPYDPVAHRQRNLIERMFCRLKDFRRVATRYDKLARNLLATAMFAATIIWWIN